MIKNKKFLTHEETRFPSVYEIKNFEACQKFNKMGRNF